MVLDQNLDQNSFVLSLVRVWLQTPHYADTSNEVAVFHLIRIAKAVYHFQVILFELMTRNENTSFDKA